MTIEQTKKLTPPASSVLRAIAAVRTGNSYDLDSGRFPGMPIWAGHPPFQVVSYRTPAGLTNQGDQEWLAPGNNKPNIKFISELIIAGCHSGTHMDALAHITCGDENSWFGGVSADSQVGDFGPLQDDASQLPILIARGVLVDIPASMGIGHLPKGYAISLSEFERAIDEQGVSIGVGDMVCIRTGQMSAWPDPQKWAEVVGSGITLEVADMLLAKGVCAIGADNEGVEVMPSIDPDNPHPVHARVLGEAGIHLIENMYLEDLAGDGHHEFMFIASPPKITGATGSFVRPIAVV
jgi:kynurenine formamidase